MKKTLHIICHYHQPKKGLPSWVILYFILFISLTFGVLMSITTDSYLTFTLVLCGISLCGISALTLTLYLSSSHSPVKYLKWKKLLQTFSEYSSLISENKPTRWEVLSMNNTDIIKFKPTASIPKSMELLETEISEKLTQFLEVKTKKIWYVKDTIPERSSITIIFTHEELTRDEVEFNV